MRRVAIRFRSARLLTALLSVVAPVSVAGSQAVRWTTDAAALQEETGQSLWRWLAAQPCRAVPWRMPTAGGAASVAAAAMPARDYIRRIVGVLPPSIVSTIQTRRTVYEDVNIRVELVTISSRMPGATVVGYLGMPRQRTEGGSPAALLLHGAYSRPGEAFGWRSKDAPAITLDGTGLSGIGAALLRRGFVVFAPIISDDYQFNQSLPWLELENLGATLRANTGHGNALMLAMTQLITSVDFLKDAASTSVSVVGWEEGAFLAALTAALDPRVDAVVRLSPPRDTRLMRMTPAGLRVGAPFTNLDCVVTEVVQSALVFPRPLLYASAADDPMDARNRQFVSAFVADTIRTLANLSRAAFAVRRFGHAGQQMSESVATWIAEHVSAPAVINDSPNPLPASDVRYAYDELAAYRLGIYTVVGQSGRCSAFDAHVDITDKDALERTAQTYRRAVEDSLGVDLSRPRSPIVVVRERVTFDAPYTLEWLWLRSKDGQIELGGLLATPQGRVKSRLPAVLSFDGNYGVGQVFGLPPTGRTEYLGAYGDYLARHGVVVFVPARPSWEPRGLGALLMWRHASRTREDWVLNYYALALDFLLTEPAVDSSDVVAYGISEAAYAALYLTAFDARVTGLVFSDPFVLADSYFRDPTNAGSGVWQYDVCNSVDLVMRYLVVPRRFTWEGDNSDLSRYRVDPLEGPSRIADTYRAVGAADAFRFRRHLGDHVTKIEELFRDMPFRQR